MAGPPDPPGEEYSELEMGEVRLLDNPNDPYHTFHDQQDKASVLANPYLHKQRRRDTLYECWTQYPHPAFNCTSAVLALVAIVLLAGQLIYVRQEAAEMSSNAACAPEPSLGPEYSPAYCAGPVPNTIGEVQGMGNISPKAGQTVTIKGTVTGDFQGIGQAGGFFMQDMGDGNPATSDGIYVYSKPAGAAGEVAQGDLVVVTGSVSEYFGLTEVTLESVTICSSGNALPAPVLIASLPQLSSASNLERFEGMYVTLGAMQTIQDTYALGRYGKLVIGEGGRQYVGTQTNPPGGSAIMAEAYQKRIILGDTLTSQNPVAAPYGLSPSNAVRVGDTFAAGSVSGVLTFEDYTSASTATEIRGMYTIILIGALPIPDRTNPRPTSLPDVGGSMKVVSANVLNYFNGPSFPTSRGATTPAEFARQRAKLISMCAALKADVYGFSEIENDGYGPESAVQDLVNGMNSAMAGAQFTALKTTPEIVGTDQISVKFLYNANTVKPVGEPKIMESTVDPTFIDNLNRPSVIATFLEYATGGKVTLVVNHLKSKGSNCNAVNDTDQGDGQGNCNLTRTKAAQALMRYLAKDPTSSGDPDFIILGDLNAYHMEDPITAFKAGVLGSAVSSMIDVSNATSWSYVFQGRSGSLDHILYSPSVADQATGAAEWHINADEPPAEDYQDYNQPALYTQDPYRTSDHDPITLGLDQSVSFTNLVKDVLQADLAALNLSPSNATTLLSDHLDKALKDATDLDDSVPASEKKRAQQEGKANNDITGKKLSDDINQYTNEVDMLVNDGILTAAQGAVLKEHAGLISDILN